MNSNYEIWPRYGAPAITDSQCKLEYVDEAGLTRSAARGVATYCDKTAFLNRLQNVQPNLEATTTLHKYEDFTGNAMRMRNVVFMSFHRNTNTNVRKDSATIAEIKTTFRKREGSKNGPADQHKRCTDCGGLNFDSESDLRNHASSTLSPA